MEVERSVDDAGVPPARVLRDPGLSLKDDESTVVPRGEPVRDGRPENAPADDGHVHGFHRWAPIRRVQISLL